MITVYIGLNGINDVQKYGHTHTIMAKNVFSKKSILFRRYRLTPEHVTMLTFAHDIKIYTKMRHMIQDNLVGELGQLVRNKAGIKP